MNSESFSDVTDAVVDDHPDDDDADLPACKFVLIRSMG
jgi:hypothetical protein